MLEGMNYIHSKFQINNFKKNKLSNFKNSGNFGLKKAKKKKRNKECCYTTLKIENTIVLFYNIKNRFSDIHNPQKFYMFIKLLNLQ